MVFARGRTMGTKTYLSEMKTKMLDAMAAAKKENPEAWKYTETNVSSVYRVLNRYAVSNDLSFMKEHTLRPWMKDERTAKLPDGTVAVIERLHNEFKGK